MTPDPLSPRAQALLDAARDGLGPDDAAIARMRDKVLAGTGGIGVAAGTAKAGMSLAAKLTIVSLVAAVVGGGAWWMMRDTGAAHRGGGSREGRVAATAVAESPAPRSASAGAGASASAGAPAGPSASAGNPVALTETPKEPAKKPAAASKTRAPSLADEVALVDDAMAALRRDDPGAALAAADDHVARFGMRGQLAEEASAIRVESLCRLGDARWSAALDAFDQRWPRSAQRPRLTAACKGVQ